MLGGGAWDPMSYHKVLTSCNFRLALRKKKSAMGRSAEKGGLFSRNKIFSVCFKFKQFYKGKIFPMRQLFLQVATE